MSKTTEIICILDRSGSMDHLAKEVISSFNEFIDDQKKVPGKAKVTLVLFDDKYEMVYDRMKLADMPLLTSDIYFTRGMTAMNDAIGKTITAVDPKRKKAIVLIQTDGMENASQEYGTNAIKSMVKGKEKDGWKFVFLGANINSTQEGSRRGFNHNVNYKASAVGVKSAYTVMGDATVAYRTDESMITDSIEPDQIDINAKNAKELVNNIRGIS